MFVHSAVSSRRLIAAVGLLVGLTAADAFAWGPMPIIRRNVGVLACDSTLDKIYMVRDLDNDGDSADPGEVTVFFDGTNAAGLAAPTGAIFALFQTDDGTVYAADGDTDSVYALKDLNNDLDALDAGEARLYYSSVNASLLPLPSPQGIAQGPDCAIYIANAGITASPQDAIFRTIDLNNDGDANDAGEQSIYVDETALGVNNPAPFECSFIGNDIYFVDPRGNAADAVLYGRDADNNDMIDAFEFGEFHVVGGPVAAPVSFTCQTDGTSIFVHESSTSAIQTVWKLTDMDSSGTINMVNEGVSIWSETSLPVGAAMANSFSFSLGAGKIAISSNGADNVDEIIIASDLNGDGDYNDVGGTSIFSQGVVGASFPENLRAVMFYGRPCLADINLSGTVTVQDIFDFLAYYFSNNARADINCNGAITVQDIFDFLSFYFAGCP